MVQQDDEGHNYFLVAILQNSRWFRELKVADQRSAAALAILNAFLKRGKAVIKAKKAQKLTGSDLVTLLHGARVSDLERIVIPRHPPVFGGDLEQTWKTWTNVMFSGAAPEEIRSLRALQAEYQPKLVEALAKINI
jgi:hypothetical protein